MNATDPKDFPINQELIPEQFRVAIFGSARTDPKSEVYKTVYDLAYEIGKHEIDVVTGGGPGVMEAANFGHKAGSKDEVKSIGLTIELPFENEGNKHLDIKKHFNTFSKRLDTFMDLSNIAVVMPGGIGTALELFYTWQLVQVKHVAKTPIILHGKIWHHLRSWVNTDLRLGGYISSEDMDYVYSVDTNEEALELIFDFYEQYKKHGEEKVLASKKFEL